MPDGDGMGGKVANIASEAFGAVTDTIGSELKNVAGTAVSQTTGMQITPQAHVTQQQLTQMTEADKAKTDPLIEEHKRELEQIAHPQSSQEGPQASNSESPNPKESKTPSLQGKIPQTPEEARIQRTMIMEHHEKAEQLGQKTPQEEAEEQQAEQLKLQEEEQRKQKEEQEKMTEPVALPGSPAKGAPNAKQKATTQIIGDATNKDMGNQKKG